MQANGSFSVLQAQKPPVRSPQLSGHSAMSKFAVLLLRIRQNDSLEFAVAPSYLDRFSNFATVCPKGLNSKQTLWRLNGYLWLCSGIDR
jgi:hypothetical protein